MMTKTDKPVLDLSKLLSKANQKFHHVHFLPCGQLYGMPRGNKKSHATRSSGGARRSIDAEKQMHFTMKSRGPSFLNPDEASPQNKFRNWKSVNSAGMPHLDRLTLAQEACYTVRHGQASNCQSLSLRNKLIFASAGSSDLLDDTARSEPQHLDVEATFSDSQKVNNSSGTRSKHKKKATQRVTHDRLHHSANKNTTASLEITGQELNDTPSTVPLDTSSRPSSQASNSSDEVILFRGRNCKISANVSSVTTETRPPTQCQPSQQIAKYEFQTGPIKDLYQSASGIEAGDGMEDRGKRSRQRQLWGRRTSRTEDLILDDYIANMRENAELCEDICHGVPTGRASNNTITTSETQANVHDETDAESEGSIRTVHDNVKLKPSAPAYNVDDADELERQMQDICGADALVKMLEDQKLETEQHGDPTATQPYRDINSTASSDLDESHNPDTFDLMDWDRPSVQRSKNKWAHGQLESNHQLHVVLENDRLKKKQRKKQCEELRARGLLGQKIRQDDLRVKYPTGMSLAEVIKELRTFLQGIDEVLSFPPLDVHARKLIHEMANRPGIKSKSTGIREQRRPVIYRTKRTLPNAEATLDQIAVRVQCRYLPRLDMKGKRSQIRTAAANGSSTATSYRDGEIVGATAPELGNENRGRAMLEKMGWSNGTALGAAHNKGILQPVTHAVKRSKAGLG